jgi:uncharacterized damage-inducible protein DinB
LIPTSFGSAVAFVQFILIQKGVKTWRKNIETYLWKTGDKPGLLCFLSGIDRPSAIIPHAQPPTSLTHHQSWADATLLTAVQAYPNSLHDEQILKTLHHILMAQRIFLSRFLARPFDKEKESQRPEQFDELVELYRATHQEQLAFVTNLNESDLERRFDLPALKSQPTIAEGLTQIVMHSQNHRGQCLTRLRENGAKPPTLDYILWAKDRPAPAWPNTESAE